MVASAINPTSVPARSLPAREIGDVPEQAADRRAQDMQDFEGPFGGHAAVNPFLSMTAAAMDYE